jgi:hypothetical protein
MGDIAVGTFAAITATVTCAMTRSPSQWYVARASWKNGATSADDQRFLLIPLVPPTSTLFLMLDCPTRGERFYMVQASYAATDECCDAVPSNSTVIASGSILDNSSPRRTTVDHHVTISGHSLLGWDTVGAASEFQ